MPILFSFCYHISVVQSEIRIGKTSRNNFIVQNYFIYLELLSSDMKLCFVLSSSVKNCFGILIGVGMNLQITFVMVTNFTMLLLPICKHGGYFNLFISCFSFLLFKDLKFLLYGFLSCLYRVTLKYFILFVAIGKRVVSLISCQYVYHFYIGRQLTFL